MKIKMADLFCMIREEIEKLMITEGKKGGPYKFESEKAATRRARQRTMDLNRRKRSMLGGELQALGLGIAEEDESDIEEYNRFHNKKGHWSSEENSTCASSFFRDRRRDRVKGGKTLSLTNRGATGRGLDPEGHGDRRCYDDEKLFEDGDAIVIDRERFKQLVADELASIVSDWEGFLANEEQEEGLLKDNDSMEQLRRRCKRLGLMDFKEFLKGQNLMAKSSKGDLFKNDKQK